MITTKNDLVQYIQADEYMQPPNPNFPLRFFPSRIIKLKRHLRKCEYHYNVCSRNLLFKFIHIVLYYFHLMRLRQLCDFYCSEIPINVFGKGLVIWHCQRIIVNPHAIVGDYCSLSSGVVIAQAHDENPTIGDYVELMVDSKVLGGISVADHVRIGANALVLKPITEPNTTWVGCPACKINDSGTIEFPVPRVK